MAKSESSNGTSTSASRATSPRDTGSRRPKLMRSSATAPCLATSNACRSDLAYLHSASRATALLNRVASYSPVKEHDGTLQPNKNLCQRAASPARRNINDEVKSSYSASGLYFSFPSFEDFQEQHEDNEKLSS